MGELEGLDRDLPAPTGSRRYELATSPGAVVEMLREAGCRVLTPKQAARARGPKPFAVATGEGFVLYKPWRSGHDGPNEAMFSGDFTVGPAVEGRVVATPRGARLELRARNFAATPDQRTRAFMGVLSWLAFAVAPFAIGGLHPAALALSAFIFVGGIASTLIHDRKRRAQDLRELLAIVEGCYGPLELPEADPAPHRRRED